MITKMRENIIHLNQPEIENAQGFADQVANGEVTHGIICYRTVDGNINYRLFNPEHMTYIIGLMERTKMFLMEG